MIQLSQLAQAPFLLYGVILAGTACLIFGIASLIESRAAADSARRAQSLPWMVTNISNTLVPKDQIEQSALKTWLLQAGYDASNAVQIYYAARVIAAITLPAILLFGLPLYLKLPQQMLHLICLIAAIIGFFLPVYVVRATRARRQRKFREGLPDVLDLLLVCSESGLGLDMAILKVGEEMREPHPLLARELQIISTELRAGLERRDAMRGFAARTGIDETASLVNLLVQSDALGTSMAHTLRTFAED